MHVWNGFTVALLDKGRARAKGYAVRGNAGGSSHKTVFSQNMIWTGLLLLGFLIFHIATMKYGVGSTTATYTLQDGNKTEVRDLYKVVVDWFANPGIVFLYVFVMATLSAHLSHGIWSGFQSLGLLDRGYYRQAVTASRVIAVVLGVGFLVLPVVVFLMQTKFQSETGGLFQ
jgi:succinate dehydrogenase / fumarate reductase cytochrome b subunit